MLDLKRRPVGRPPKVRPEASVPLPEKSVAAEDKPSPRLYQIPEVPPERAIEVEIMRKYAPEGQDTEIRAVVHPGTIMKLPVAEATRVLKLGIARGTDDTFKE